MEKLIIIGAGGFAKSALDSVDEKKYHMVGFLEEYSDKKEHMGLPIIAHSLAEIENPDQYVYFIAVGNNHNRAVWYKRLKEKNLRLTNIVDPSAIVSRYSNIGEGCFVGKLAIINAGVTIGNNCVINTKALVEHGCFIHDNVNISPNAVLNGDVIVEEGTFIGSASVTIGQKHIGAWSMVGAGAVVTKDLGDYVTAVGIPAKVIKGENA